jgi:glycosyltransferase involved in cell wall biosynthesis
VNILLSCLSYREYTGSELYFYELSTALRDAGHVVSIFSPFVDNPLRDRTNNIKFPNKDEILKETYDLVLFSHGKVIWEYLKGVKTNKLINIIHSEVIDLEEPVDDSKIDLYVGIRPSIVNFIKGKIPTANIKLIYNPFDFTRFNPQTCKKKKSIKDKIVLFPGSLDYLRYKPLRYLLDLSEKQNFKVLHVGRSDYSTVHPNFTTSEPTWNVEKYYKQCDIVSGIFLGRTSIEGLLCNKKVLQFDVDNRGNIKKVYWHTDKDLQKFNKENVIKLLLNEL